MNQIKRLRMLNGIKQADLAKMLQVSRAALSGYETGKFEASLDIYITIADIFGVSLDYLLGRTNVKNPVPLTEIGNREALTEPETDLLGSFRKLNGEGQAIALNTVRGLVLSGAYIKNPVLGAVQEIG